jgi:hypothetical protein
MKDRILIKNKEGFEPITESEEERHYIYPFVQPEYLLYINNPDEMSNQLTIYERLSFSDDLRRSGLLIGGRLVYLSKKLGIFFSTWVLSLFLSGLAWRRRSVYEFPPTFKLIIFSVITPFIVYLLHLMYIGMNEIIIYSHNYFTRLVTGRLNVAVWVVLLNCVIAVIATFYFLAQKSGAD